MIHHNFLCKVKGLATISILITSLNSHLVNSEEHQNHHYDDESHFHPEVSENVVGAMYFDDKIDSQDSESENNKIYTVIDHKTGKEIETVIGKREFPHAAIMEVRDIHPSGSALFLNNPKAYFSSTQEIVDLALPSKYYAIDSSTIYLDAGMQTTTEPEFASYAIIADPVSDKLFVPTLFSNISWNECTDSVLQGKYFQKLPEKCYVRQMFDRFKKTLRSNTVRCSSAGLRLAKMANAKSVFLLHKGTTCDRRHSRRSLHCIGRALDIHSFKIHRTDNKHIEVIYSKAYPKKTWQRSFYTGFAKCWSDTLIKQRRNCVHYKGDDGYTGIINWVDSRHREHIHVSYPECSSKRKYFKE